MLRAGMRGPLRAEGGPVAAPPQLPPRGVAHEVARLLGPEGQGGQDGRRLAPSSSPSRRRAAQVPRGIHEVWHHAVKLRMDHLFLYAQQEYDTYYARMTCDRVRGQSGQRIFVTANT